MCAATTPISERWPGRFGPLPSGDTCDVLSQSLFHAALHREQRRSERSGNTLLIATFEVNGPQASKDCPSLQCLAAVVGSVVRETDIVGWFETGGCLGVLLTEIRETVNAALLDRVDLKFKRALSSGLPAGTERYVRITYRVAADPIDPGALNGPPKDRAVSVVRDESIRVAKRCIDIVGSALVLTVSSPLLVLVAVGIRLTSRGDVVYRQERVGEAGRIFTCLKFRSMYQDSDPGMHREYVTRMIRRRDSTEAQGGTPNIYKIVQDPRITPIGRWLRRTSLDEFPQFVNVLKGDMSLVGPRPALPYEFEQYCAWHRRRVVNSKPGITGLWQIQGRSRTSFDEAVRLDLQYIRRMSLWLDLEILLKTPAAVISGKGAY